MNGTPGTILKYDLLVQQTLLVGNQGQANYIEEDNSYNHLSKFSS